MSEKTSPDGFCRIAHQNPGCSIYFGKELTALIQETMPLSNTKDAPKYVVAVDPGKITITVAKL